MISPSQANTYRKCPEAWRLRYQEGIKLAPAWAIRGRAAHRGIEVNMAQKVETRRDLPEDDVLDAFRTSVREAFHNPSDEEIVLEGGESEASITDAGVIGLAAYHRDLAPGIQPIMTEARLEHDFGGLVVQGIIDILDEGLLIRDSKMMTDMPKPENLVWETQPPVYSALVEAVTGAPPAGVVFDVVALGRGRVPTPRTVSLPIAVPAEQITRTLDDLRQVEASIKAGIVYRRPGPWTCRGCGYQKLCWGNAAPPMMPEGVAAAPPSAAASCRALAERIKLKPAVRDHLYTKHCGTTAIEGADPAAVADLRQELDKLAAGVKR